MLWKAVIFRQSTHLKYWQSNLVASATHCWLRASNPSREHAKKKYQKFSASVNKLPHTLNNSWLQLRLKLQTLFKLHSSKGCQDFQKNQCNFFWQLSDEQLSNRSHVDSKPHFLLHFIPVFVTRYSSSLSPTRLQLVHSQAHALISSIVIRNDLEWRQWMPAYPRDRPRILHWQVIAWRCMARLGTHTRCTACWRLSGKVGLTHRVFFSILGYLESL
jgi:hypothetical protein